MNLTVFKALALTVALLLVSGLQTAVAQQQQRETIEQAYFKVIDLPRRGARGAIEIFVPDEFGDGICKNCGQRYKFDENLRIRIAGETSTMSHQLLAQLPKQLAYFVVQGDSVVTIGISDLQLPDRIANDL